eukprot:14168037-Alexandrium_andersonii.AAC.1
MSASLVGSEMCIRDRSHAAPRCDVPGAVDSNMGMGIDVDAGEDAQQLACLLYTSDAADDM